MICTEILHSPLRSAALASWAQKRKEAAAMDLVNVEKVRDIKESLRGHDFQKVTKGNIRSVTLQEPGNKFCMKCARSARRVDLTGNRAIDTVPARDAEAIPACRAYLVRDIFAQECHQGPECWRDSEQRVQPLGLVHAQLSTIVWLPAGVEVGHDRQHPVAAVVKGTVPECIQMSAIEGAGPVPCKVAFEREQAKEQSGVQEQPQPVAPGQPASFRVGITLNPADVIAADKGIEHMVAAAPHSCGSV